MRADYRIGITRINGGRVVSATAWPNALIIPNGRTAKWHHGKVHGAAPILCYGFISPLRWGDTAERLGLKSRFFLSLPRGVNGCLRMRALR